MSYQGIRRDHQGKWFVRFRVQGQIEERGPYGSAAEALKNHLGEGVDRHRPSAVKSQSRKGDTTVGVKS